MAPINNQYSLAYGYQNPYQIAATNTGLFGNTYTTPNIFTASGTKTPINIDGTNFYVGSNSPWTSDLSSINGFSDSLKNYNFGDRYGLNATAGEDTWQDTLNRWDIDSNSVNNLNSDNSSWFGANGILAGIGSIGNLALGGLQAYTNLSALNAQKDALRWQKDIAYNNLNNSIQSYNNRLTDIMQARAAMETGDKNAYDDQIAERSLQRNGE